MLHNTVEGSVWNARLDPQFAAAYYIRGLTYETLGKTKAAEQDFAKAKELGYEPLGYTVPRGRVMLTGIRHRAVLVLGFVLLALTLAACGDGPSEADIEATAESIASRVRSGESR